ncbi:vesicle transport V-SNARE protein [Ceratocystis lukuohia]|uniref:Vesicle transport V-SNARE protein n=1 Tax=Ceratocystis lukuohia TaxID=2019550 RepID=A0ABR4MAW0_9PEZI
MATSGNSGWAQLRQQARTLESQYSHLSNIPPKPTSEEKATEEKLKDLLGKLLRDKLSDHKRDLGRLRTTLQQARDRANLLSNVRDDIDQYRANNPEAAEADYMLDERNRIDNSHNMADSVLSQAYAVRDDFIVQSQTLQNISRRITHAASQVPGLNQLMNQISARKRRDSIIMGSFIAFCFLMFWWFF